MDEFLSRTNGRGVKAGCRSLVSSDTVSRLSGPALMACPLWALQRPWSLQQSVTSHLPLQHGQNNTFGKLHVCLNISHSQPVLTPGEHTVTWGNHCSLWIPGAPRYSFVMENTHTPSRKKKKWVIPVLFFLCRWCSLQYRHVLFLHTSSLCSFFFECKSVWPGQAGTTYNCLPRSTFPNCIIS